MRASEGAVVAKSCRWLVVSQDKRTINGRRPASAVGSSVLRPRFRHPAERRRCSVASSIRCCLPRLGSVCGATRSETFCETRSVVEREQSPCGGVQARAVRSKPCGICGNAAGDASAHERVGRGKKPQAALHSSSHTPAKAPTGRLSKNSTGQAKSMFAFSPTSTESAVDQSRAPSTRARMSPLRSMIHVSG